MYGDPPDPPDYGPLAEVNKELGEANLKFMQEQFNWSKDTTKQVMKIGQQVADEALKVSRSNRDFADTQRKRYEKEYVPLERKFVKEAQGYDTGKRRREAMATAMVDVGQKFDAARESAERRLAGFGIDPSMLRAGSLDLGSRLEEAEAKVQASTGARRRVEDVGRALRADVVNMGRGLPVQAATAYNTSLGGGQTASGASTGAAATGTQVMTSPAVYGSQAQSAFNSSAGILSTGYDQALAAYNSNPLNQILQMAGGYAMGRFKEGGPVTPDMSPSRGAVSDDVPAQLNEGEYVVPSDVVAWKGQEFFEKLKMKARQDQQGGRQAVPAGRN